MVVSSTKSTSTKINNLFARPGLGAGAFFMLMLLIRWAFAIIWACVIIFSHKLIFLGVICLLGFAVTEFAPTAGAPNDLQLVVVGIIAVLFGVLSGVLFVVANFCLTASRLRLLLLVRMRSSYWRLPAPVKRSACLRKLNIFIAFCIFPRGTFW